jgi:hypothetical protein
VRHAVVAIEGRPADEGLPSQEGPPFERRPATDPVQETGTVDQVDGGRDEARGLERLAVGAAPADGRKLHEARPAKVVVPAGDPGVRGPEIERPAVHGGPL